MDNRKTHDWLSLASSLSDEHESTVWAYVQRNYDALSKRFPKHDRAFGRLIENVADQFHTQTMLAEVKYLQTFGGFSIAPPKILQLWIQVLALIAEHPHAGAGERSRQQAVDKIRWNIVWHRDHLPKTVQWIRENL